jgi:lipoate-protein ligase B
LVDAATSVGVGAETRAGLTGIWCGGRKLASIGVHAREWVTTHGAALNVENDLSTFQHIVPCGLEAVEMTSIARESERAGVAYAGWERTETAVEAAIRERFGMGSAPGV